MKTEHCDKHGLDYTLRDYSGGPFEPPPSCPSCHNEWRSSSDAMVGAGLAIVCWLAFLVPLAFLAVAACGGRP